ncbi:class I SAM-dependent methyltransferase [Aestuariibacter sp. AA17]|uniref:Class I SAM-dependent methyltransferase n=1 Tax=Fluctibacter corallii TaxID=2984329 RepID=A0ABT3A9S3_9ALTE|nr:class I SAM-dependent methyltransferase [Aestuariibacter sp. AA17]MCV2885432.1 class I SAM-dependent methyltransferase [Aestuariibacter sp. AA17]
MENVNKPLSEEAKAFNHRIEERVSEGFIPDLRRNQRCEFFYKSFWRDPVFSDLYVGNMFREYRDILAKYVQPGARILDAGCGAGYFALELAREGYNVVAIDIADSAIEQAKTALESNPYKDNFGHLEYHVGSIEQIKLNDSIPQTYDAILFSGVLHHLVDLDLALDNAYDLLKDGGVILGHEPCHENWTKSDAAITSLMRLLLSHTDSWYESKESLLKSYTPEAFQDYVDDIFTEYTQERDKHESGQSPNDNSCNGKEITNAVKKRFSHFKSKPSAAFMYRMLGGVRRPNISQEQDIARLLALFDQFATSTGILNPNYFFFSALK